MNFRSSTRRPRTLEMDMTPMIDIVFQLLLFFLTTTQLAAIVRLELDLPRERGQQQGGGAEPGLIVNLRRDGALVVLEEEVTLERLGAMAAQAIAETRGRGALEPLKPVIRADQQAPAAALNALLVALRDAGVEGINLAVSPGG